MTRTKPAVSTVGDEPVLINEVAANFESWDAYNRRPRPGWACHLQLSNPEFAL